MKRRLYWGFRSGPVRRWRDRFEASGAEGLYDRRLGRPSGRRLTVDTVMAVLELFDTRYWDFTAIVHFWEKLSSEHGFTCSYNWVRLILQAHGRIRPAPRRRAHRRKRERRPLGGMMLHQDGSSHQWVDGAMVGFDRHHGRCHLRYIFRPVCRRGRHHEQLPGARRGDCGLEEAVLFAVCQDRRTAPITGTLGRRGARWTPAR